LNPAELQDGSTLQIVPVWAHFSHFRGEAVFFLVLGIELRAYTLSYSTSPIFVKGFLR
jgi:hypothetical protein